MSKRSFGETMRFQNAALLTLVLLLMPINRCEAQSPAGEKAAAMTAIHAGRLVDVASGKVTKDAYVVVQKDRTVRITDQLPKGATEIDLSKYTVVPGLIDAHSHLLGNPKDQSSTAGLRMSSAQAA